MNLLTRFISTVTPRKTNPIFRRLFRRLGLSGAATLLLPVLLFLVLSIAAHAQTTTGTTADGLIYASTSGTVNITGYSGTGGAVIIPDSISVSGSNIPVTSSGS